MPAANSISYPPQIDHWSSTEQTAVWLDKKAGANYVRDHILIPDSVPPKYIKVTVFIDHKTLLKATPDQIQEKLDLATKTLIAAWKLAPKKEFDVVHIKSFESSQVQYWKDKKKSFNVDMKNLVPSEISTEEEEDSIHDLRAFLKSLPPEKASKFERIKNVFSKIFPEKNEDFINVEAKAELDSDPAPIEAASDPSVTVLHDAEPDASDASSSHHVVSRDKEPEASSELSIEDLPAGVEEPPPLVGKGKERKVS